MKSRLLKIVASRDQYITEIHEKQPHELLLIKDIDMNFKIKTAERFAPLKINVSHPGKPQSKNIMIFASFENKEPSKNSNTASYLNP